MESTESITNKACKSPYPALDKALNAHVNWTEVDDDDIVRGPEEHDYYEESRNMRSIELPKYPHKSEMILDSRGSHEVIIEQVEEEKQPIKKQNVRYKYLQAEEAKTLRKIESNNKRSRRKSLNDAYYTPLIKRSDAYPDIRINEPANSFQSFEKYIHSHRERREIDNSDDEIKQLRLDSLLSNKHLSSKRKDKLKSSSESHSPFGSFNDQTNGHNHIDDYGRTWTSATLATPCNNDDFGSIKDERMHKRLHEESKIKESQSDIIRNVKLTYLSASSLSDDRWL